MTKPPPKARAVEQSLFPDIRPDKPVGRILPSVFRGTNADLMYAVARYYLDGSVLDVTFGEGAWWQRFTPEPFSAHDKHTLDGVDFTALPEADGSIDTVCFDPPYVTSGGEPSARLVNQSFQSRFGIGVGRLGHSRPDDLGALIAAGLAECARVSRRYILVKCMEYAQGGHPDVDFRDMPFQVRVWAAELGLVTHDVIVHHTGTGPGGHNIFDPKRARREHSYLIVLKHPRLDNRTPIQ